MDMNNPQMAGIAQAMQSDPEMMQLMQDPEIMAKLQRLQSDPSSAMSMMSDPQMMPILAKLKNLMGGRGGEAAAAPLSQTPSPHVLQVTGGEAQFALMIAEAKKQKKLLAVDFYTTWCGPCKQISPVFNALADEHHATVLFAKVDGDQQMALVKAQGISSYPSFQFYYNGVQVDSFSGARSDQLRSIVSQYAEIKAQCPHKHFPLRDTEIVTHPRVKFEVVIPKLKDINTTQMHAAAAQQQQQQQHTSDSLALTTTDIGQLDAIVLKLNDKTKYHVSEFSASQYAIVNKLLQWPSSNNTINMCLHLFRALVLHPHASAHYAQQLKQQLDAQQHTNSSTDVVARLCAVMSEADKPMTVQLCVWTISNMFARRNLQLHVSDRHEQVLDATATAIMKFVVDAPAATAAATEDDALLTACVGLYINYAILFCEDHKHYLEGKVLLLSAVIEMLDRHVTVTASASASAGSVLSAKLLYRLLVIVGTLVYLDQNCSELCVDLDGKRIVTALLATATNQQQTAASADTAGLVAVCNELLTAISGEAA